MTVDEGSAGDQHRRAAAETIQQGDHLRHRGHLDAQGQHAADDGADRNRCRDHEERIERGLGEGWIAVEERRNDGHQHAGGTEQVAADRGAGMRESLQAEDEEHCRGQIRQIDHRRLSPSS